MSSRVRQIEYRARGVRVYGGPGGIVLKIKGVPVTAEIPFTLEFANAILDLETPAGFADDESFSWEWLEGHWWK